MELTRFEIRKQLGLARVGKFKFGAKTFTTPNFYLPQNPTILQSLSFTQEGEKRTTPSALQKLTAFQPLAGYVVDDPMQITVSPETSDRDAAPIKYAGCFFESQEMLGFPIARQESAEDIITALDAIPVLGDNFPNRESTRYPEYHLHALQLRLNFYDEILLPADTNPGKILLWHRTRMIG